MSEQATIDALRFAQEHQRLTGSIPLAGLARLSDVLLDPAGQVEYELAGGVDRSSKPTIDIELRVCLAMRCQRCLGRVDVELTRKARFSVVPDAEELPDVGEEDPNVEAMPASALAGIADVIEQEILLGLPLAPMHAEGSCAAEFGAGAERQESPFAVLATLKTT